MFGMEDCIFSADVVKKLLLDNPDEKEIRLNIHCDGGLISEGLAIYDLLRTSGRTLHASIEGSCHSMSTVLLLAAPAENRTGNINLRAVIHLPRTSLCGTYTADEITAISKELAKEEKTILDIYEERTGKNRAALAAWMTAEKARTATELLNMNFISGINSYNTNFKQKKMNRTGKQPQGAIAKAVAFLGRAKALLAPDGGASFAYCDAEGNTVFTAATETDVLAVGDSVMLSGDGKESDGVFTLDDGRVVTIADSVVTEIADAQEEGEEGESEGDAVALAARITMLEGALSEAGTVITELKDQLQSHYTPAKRTMSKQHATGVMQKTPSDDRSEARERLKKFRGGA
jgi:ATP-dependent protease ClpP protease subunit